MDSLHQELMAEIAQQEKLIKDLKLIITEYTKSFNRLDTVLGDIIGAPYEAEALLAKHGISLQGLISNI